MDAIVPIKVNDEIKVDLVKMTETSVLILKNGTWIELRPPGESPEVAKNTATLRDLIAQILSAKNIRHGDGPPMAYIQTPPDTQGAVRRFVYVAFGNDGIKPEGTSMRGAATFGDVLRTSTAAFDAWLQPRRTLVWRERPIIDFDKGLWRVYWRCVQLDDAARSIAVDWNF